MGGFFVLFLLFHRRLCVDMFLLLQYFLFYGLGVEYGVEISFVGVYLS